MFDNLLRILRRYEVVRAPIRYIKCAIILKIYGLKNVHSTCHLKMGSYISNDLVAGSFCYISNGCYLCPKVRLGRYVLIAPEVAILGGDHVIDNPELPIIFSGRPNLPETIIGDDVWIGYRAVLMAGICVGNGAVIGACSVVTKDVPSYTIVSGCPAKEIRKRFPNEKINIHKEMLAKLPYVKGKRVNLKETFYDK